MHPPGAGTVLVRHRELGTKSDQVQRRMELVLGENLRAMLTLHGIDASVERHRGRLFVRTTPDAVEQATDAATTTFGVASASPTVSMPPEREAILDTLARTARVNYEDGSFAVRARRAGPTEAHGFTSIEIEEDGGSVIWEAVSDRLDPVVDLETPDHTFYVECREAEAYVFLEKRDGPGGFPLGTQGTVVPLVSGGTDSPVAAWEIMRRGCQIVPVYFDFGDYGGPDHVARAIESVRHLAAYSPSHPVEMHVAPIGDAVDRLMEDVGGTRMLSLRRVMFAVAERIAGQVGAHALVTGESIGQKSSQTGHNLAATTADIRLPIYRPLIDRDKQDIIAQAKAIGTHEEATIDAGCNRVAPTHPATSATRAEVVAAEPDGFLQCVESILERVEVVNAEPRTDEPRSLPINGGGTGLVVDDRGGSG